MKTIQSAAFIFLCVFFAGCGLVDKVRGSGKVITETRTVSGFSSVSLSGSANLEVDQNGTESLTITADDNLLPLLISEVKGSQLTIGTKDGTNLDPSKRIIVKVGAKSLDGIALAGDVSAVATNVHTGNLRLELAGSGDIKVSGTVDHQEIIIAGSGKYEGANLKSKSTKINIAGSGDAVIAASDNLEVTIAGSGNIKYIGDPDLKQNVMGSGSISKQ